MFSGPLGKAAISVGAGIAVGLIDAAGFFYTAKLFINNTVAHARAIAAAAEASRLILLIAFVVLLWHAKFISVLWLLGSALLLSLAGKFLFIFKGLKA
jgi:hypothetical protein